MADRESLITEAVEKVRAGELSQRRAAADYGIPRSTLQGRLAGRTDASTAKQDCQRLSPEQEEYLCDWILNEESAGRAPSYPILKEFAERILRAGGDLKPLGQHWPQYFLRRHETIHAKIKNVRESSRAQSTNFEKLSN